MDWEEHGDFIETQLVRAVGSLELDLHGLAKAYLKVYNYFSEHGRPEKTWDWFTTRNPMFGDISPLRLCLTGKTSKLLDFIEDQSCEE